MKKEPIVTRHTPKAGSVPKPIEEQLADVEAAVASVKAMQIDADTALTEMTAEFITERAVIERYVPAHARLSALNELRSDLERHAAELREAISQRAGRSRDPRGVQKIGSASQHGPQVYSPSRSPSFRW